MQTAKEAFGNPAIVYIRAKLFVLNSICLCACACVCVFLFHLNKQG